MWFHLTFVERHVLKPPGILTWSLPAIFYLLFHVWIQQLVYKVSLLHSANYHLSIWSIKDHLMLLDKCFLPRSILLEIKTALFAFMCVCFPDTPLPPFLRRYFLPKGFLLLTWQIL